jgi:stage V sporulation protein SpoVS
MTPLFSSFLQKIQEWLDSRAENQRIKAIKEALRGYAARRGINLNINNNE